jgi:hypothetical protein
MRGVTLRLFVGTLSILLFSSTGPAAQANPFGDFFKRIGRSVSTAGKHQPARRSSSAKSGSKQTDPNSENQTGVVTAVNADSASSKKFSPSVRTASVAPDSKGGKRDTPFAIPVAGKKGFVTSPFSPEGNYIDVHAFTPGTEVKDPYTGKIFRVP